VHTSCLKEIEELSFSQSEGQKKAAKQLELETGFSGANTATKEHTMEIPYVGQKRTYVDAAAEEAKTENEAQEVKIRGLQDIIRGLES